MTPQNAPAKNDFDGVAPDGVDWAAFYQNYRKPGYIAGYEIGHKLGGGVFGIVYKARKESIGKAYAIKFLRIEDTAVRAQVLNELGGVSLFAQVDHPNLVSIEDKGVVDGIPYIIMGYAGDETLKSRLAEGRLDEAEALRIFVQVARGVQALHEHSLVHFDLKPANVFMKGDVARVGDYGLSKLITETAMSLSSGRGTPYYMAPEMLRRKGDHRSDIYSLGVMLFECLTGRVPFLGESEWEVLRAHEEQPVEYPADLAPRYRRVLATMLEKDPARRAASVGDVLRMLGADASAVPLAATQSSSGAAPRHGSTVGSVRREARRSARRVIGEVRWRTRDARRRARKARHATQSWSWIRWVGLAWFVVFALGVRPSPFWIVLATALAYWVFASRRDPGARRSRPRGGSLIAALVVGVFLAGFFSVARERLGSRPAYPVAALAASPSRAPTSRYLRSSRARLRSLRRQAEQREDWRVVDEIDRELKRRERVDAEGR